MQLTSHVLQAEKRQFRVSRDISGVAAMRAESSRIPEPVHLRGKVQHTEAHKTRPPSQWDGPEAHGPIGVHQPTVSCAGRLVFDRCDALTLEPLYEPAPETPPTVGPSASSSGNVNNSSNGDGGGGGGGGGNEKVLLKSDQQACLEGSCAPRKHGTQS